MTVDDIKKAVCLIAEYYPISSVSLFGSRADGTHQPDSDVDLIIEFSGSVSLMTLSRITCELEEMLQLKVDIIHGPVRPDDMIEVHNKVLLYAA